MRAQPIAEDEHSSAKEHHARDQDVDFHEPVLSALAAAFDELLHSRSHFQRMLFRRFSTANAENRQKATRDQVRQRPDAASAPRLGLALHLRDERVQPIELASGAGSRRRTQRNLAIEIAGKVEDEGFQRGRAIVVDGRTAAEAGDAVMKRAVGAAQADGINAFL
jgi:hypothetical protein